MEENEVKKIKQLFRKGVALALAAVTTLSVLPAATVSAASQRARRRVPGVFKERRQL